MCHVQTQAAIVGLGLGLVGSALVLFFLQFFWFRMYVKRAKISK